MITGALLMPGTELAGAFSRSLDFGQLVRFCPFFLMLSRVPDWPRRDHLQIMTEILDIASREGATKTSLVYKANINFTLAKRYLEYLEKKGLIQRSNEANLIKYSLTEKGRETLLRLKKVNEELHEEKELMT